MAYLISRSKENQQNDYTTVNGSSKAGDDGKARFKDFKRLKNRLQQQSGNNDGSENLQISNAIAMLLAVYKSFKILIDHASVTASPTHTKREDLDRGFDAWES